MSVTGTTVPFAKVLVFEVDNSIVSYMSAGQVTRVPVLDATMSQYGM